MPELLSRETDLRISRTTRIIVVALFLVLVVMWSVLLYFAVNARNSAIEAEKRVLQRMTLSVQEQTHHLFSFIHYFLVSSDLWFAAHPGADPRTDPEFLRLVREFKANTEGLIDIRVVSGDGRLFYLSRPGKGALADVGDRDYYRAQLDPGTRGFFIAKPVLSRVTGVWGLPISYPLNTSPQGVSVIFAALENRALAVPLEAERTKPGGTVLIAHRNGTVLFRSPENGTIGRSLAEGELWRTQLPRTRQGVFQVERGVLDGKSRIVSYAADPSYPLVVITSSDLDDVLSRWRTRVGWLLIFGATFSLAGGLVLWRLLVSVRAIDDLSRKLAQQANIDFLTDIPNRRFFMRNGSLEIDRARRYNHPVSLMMLDLDGFKLINDRHGHKMGDAVLEAVAQAARNVLRQLDVPCRMGGEEFAVLLPETQLGQATEVAERLRKHIENLTLTSADGLAVPVTASFGVAELNSTDANLDRLLARADAALYQAKVSGRNRVCIAET